MSIELLLTKPHILPACYGAMPSTSGAMECASLAAALMNRGLFQPLFSGIFYSKKI